MLERDLKNNRIIFFPGFMLSVMGSSLFSFAMGLYILDTTKKGVLFGVNLMLLTIPMILFGAFFGKLGDRYSKKNIIVIGDLLNALLMFGIYLMWDSYDRVMLVYVGTFFSSIFSTLVGITFSAGIPELFGKGWMVQANSISQIVNSLARVSGPFLGGIIYSYGNLKLFIMINGISFFTSMVCEIFLKVDLNEGRKNLENQSIKVAFKFINEHKELKNLIIKFAIINFAAITAIIVPVPYIITRIMGRNSEFLGVVQAMIPLGAILGAIVVGKIKMELGKKVIWGIFGAFFTACFLLLTPMLLFGEWRIVNILLVVGMILSGASFGVLDVTVVTYLQKEIPQEIRGKTMGLISGIVKLTMPISYLISGVLTDSYTPFASIVLAGVLLLGTLLISICLDILRGNESTPQEV